MESPAGAEAASQRHDATQVDLLVVGDCNPDLILVGCNERPEFGQAEVLADGAVLTVGGSASILACGASRLGLRTALAASVGGDVFGRFMLGALAERGVDVSAVRVHPDKPTGVTVVLDRGHDRAQVTAPGAIRDLTAGDVPLGLLRRARHVHVSSYFLQPALQPDLPALLAGAKEAGASTSLDTNWDPNGTWDAGLWDVLVHVDVLLPNGVEAQRLSGETDPEAAARSIAERTSGAVVVKLGREGALAVRHGTVVRAPAIPVDAVDATGAGDSFAAGFIAGMLGGAPLREALSLACACGSLSTRGVGGTAAQPELAEARRAVDASRHAGRPRSG